MSASGALVVAGFVVFLFGSMLWGGLLMLAGAVVCALEKPGVRDE